MRTFLFVLLFLSSFTFADLTPEQRFGGVKKWKFIYSYSASSPFTWEEGGETHNRHTWTASESGTIDLEATSYHDHRLKLEGKGKVSASNQLGKQVTGLGNSMETRMDTGSGSPITHVGILLEFELGTYDLDVNPGDFPATYKGYKRWGMSSNKYGGEYETHNYIPFPAPAEKRLELPKSGRMISGSWSWEERWKKEPEFRNGFDPAERARVDHTHGTVNWILIPDDPVEVELLIEPEKYDEWIPQGGKDEKTAGNSITLKATLVDKKTGGAPSKKARQMTFRVAQSSKEKGVALNLPLENAAQMPDLQFEQEKNSSFSIEGEGASAKTPIGSYETASANLSSFDWGAFGTIMVTAELEDGAIVIGKLKGGTETEVLIPKRAKGSNIADAWKKFTGFTGADLDDEDERVGNDKKGDGLTAYDEYRGLVVQGKHTRTSGLLSLKKKELFIRNDIGKAAKSGLALFESASGIKVVELDEKEIPKSRRVNVNAGYGSGGAQFGLWLKKEKIANGAAGENRPAAMLNKTPKDSQEIIIDLDGSAEYYKGQEAAAKAAGMTVPFTLDESNANTIAHEIAHGVSAPHHGKDNEFRGPKKITERMVDYHIFGVDGGEVKKPFELQGRIGRPGNSASGDVGCIMAYTNYYQWAAVGRAGGPYNYYAIPLQPLGTHFCTSASATGMNVERTIGDKTLPGFFGDAGGQGSDSAVGNCLGAMTVKDW